MVDISGILKTEENLNSTNNYNNNLTRVSNLHQQLNDNNTGDVYNQTEKSQPPGNNRTVSNQGLQNEYDKPYGSGNTGSKAGSGGYGSLGYNYPSDSHKQRQVNYDEGEFSRKKVYNKDINTNIITNPNEESTAKKEQDDGEDDDPITKIKKKTLFQDFPMISEKHFGFDKKFENNVKLLKTTYEEKNDLLEKNLEYYKGHLENYFKKKIQLARNSQLENFSDHLPIINITTEHNDLLKTLREMYQAKLQDLEKVKLLINEYLF